MIPVTVAHLAAITGGQVHGTVGSVVSGSAEALVVDGPVVTDSREAGPGSLYVARIGAALDGHRFVSAARTKGAIAALTTRRVEELPCVVVADIQDGIAAVARDVLDRATDLTVVGVTGSSGKTSTKDLLATVLAPAGEVIAPFGSYNSEVGVPLTCCRVTPSTRTLVVEMGARGVGHVHYLTTIAPPRIGVVLNVGSAHVGEFGSREAIGAAKAELVAALPPDGVAVLNADDPIVRAMAGSTHARVVLVGEAGDAQVRATDVVLDGEGRASFRACTPAGDADVSLGLVGVHHVGNALAALAVALERGVPLAEATAALAAARPVSRWRMEVSTRVDGVTVVNDAYNANPESMRAALAAVGSMATRGRTWAVLGAMLELGASSDLEHAGVGEEAVRRGVDELVVVGDVATPMADAARAAGPATRTRQVPDADAAEAMLRTELRPGDVVLFKSSRDAGLRWLGERIADTATGRDTDTDTDTDTETDTETDRETDTGAATETDTGTPREGQR